MSAKLGTTISSGNGVELGTMTTSTRNSGIGTVTCTMIYNSSTNSVEAYFGSAKGWQSIKTAV